MNTEEKILQAAFEIFREDGYNGARMRAIADKAKINKGLLHYYFKTKDKLFEKIISSAIQQLQSKLRDVLDEDISVYKKLDLIIDIYFEMLKINPALPRFVISELNKNPKKFLTKNINSSTRESVNRFVGSLQCELDKKNITEVNGKQIMVSLFSLIIFPFVGKPIIQLMFNFSDEDYIEMLVERKMIIKATIKKYFDEEVKK